MGWGNPILGGIKLIRAAIQSPNYVKGVQGWSINQDGSAEFNNVVVRGTVESGQFIGTGEGEEILIYSGSPTLGNLIASVTSASFTDSHGNKGVDGVASYGPNGGIAQIAANQSSGTPFLILYPPGATHFVTPPQVIGEVQNAGAVNEAETLSLFSGTTANGGSARIDLLSSSNDGTAVATMFFMINGAENLIIGPTDIRSLMPIHATHPGGSVSETPQQATLTNATGSGNNVNGFWYWLNPDGTVELNWDIKPTALSGALFTLPAGYAPQTPQRVTSGWYGTGPASYNASWSPGFNVAANGVVSLTGLSGGTAGNFQLSGSARISMAAL